ncbi:PQQ-binding-like beta-propeller repeat protein [Kitasatospora sp. LaBMicrA B282]|uniref:outer membrane protein assembly factor BamB family protein n=1 Tax=Kitasatospora sp. LaBMicrA B282 TaxID=3420949 RepID=UPI003D11EB2B
MTVDAIPLDVTTDRATGLWTVTAPGFSLGRPVVGPERVYVVVADRITALERHSGELRWQRPVDVQTRHGLRYERLTLAGDRLLLRGELPDTRRELLVALDSATGEQVWTRKIVAWTELIRDQDTLYLREPAALGVAGADEQLTAVALSDGQPRWQQHHGSPIRSLVLAGRQLVHRDGRRAVGLDPSTGAVRWHSPPWPGYGDLLVDGVDGPVFTWEYDRQLVSWFDPATGESLGERVVRLPFGAGAHLSMRVTDGGQTLWLSQHRHRMVHWLRPLEPDEPLRTFHTGVRALDSGDEALTLAGDWVYAVDRGDRLLAGPLAKPGWLRSVGRQSSRLLPRRRRKQFELVPGGNLLYARQHGPDGYQLLGLVEGRVSWRLPIFTMHPVPVGDRLLVPDLGSGNDHLRLLDGLTGTTAGPPPRG